MTDACAKQTQTWPVVLLIRRYAAIWRAAWKARSLLAGPARSADEAAFLPAALSLQETPVHPAPRRAMLTLVALVGIALAWAVLGHVDIVALAPGRIVVSERTKLVQPLERSVVRAVRVKDGDRVRAGQALVELDPTMANADRQKAGDTLQSAQSELLRVQALLAALPRTAKPRPAFPASWTEADRATTRALLEAEWSDIAAKLERSASELAHRQAEVETARELVRKLEATFPLIQERAASAKQLANEGFMASLTAQDRLREQIEAQRDLATQQARLAEAQAALKEAGSSRQAYLAEQQRSLREREAQARLAGQQAGYEQTKQIRREQLSVLTAPVDGIVQQLAIHTDGGVVTEAQTLMVIVPDQAVATAEVTVENKDIGFVSVGQPVEVKLETFPFTRYGTVKGTVTRITADAVQDEKKGALFQATITLAVDSILVDGKRIRLSPGMNLTAEIMTGRRRIIDFLLGPARQAIAESGRER